MSRRSDARGAKIRNLLELFVFRAHDEDASHALQSRGRHRGLAGRKTDGARSRVVEIGVVTARDEKEIEIALDDAELQIEFIDPDEFYPEARESLA